MSQTYTFSELLDINSRWWDGEEIYNPVTEITNTSQVEVLQQNTYVSLLGELNRYVITVDSQDGTSTPASERHAAHQLFREDFNVPERFSGPSFEYQRTYIEFYADPETTEEIKSRLDNHPDIAYEYYDFSTRTLHMNDTFIKDNEPRIYTDALMFTEDMTEYYITPDRSYYRNDLAVRTIPFPYRSDLNFSDNVCEWFVLYKHWGALKDMEYHLPKDIYSITPIDNPEDYVIKTILGKNKKLRTQ
jgi:hypothetical protein